MKTLSDPSAATVNFTAQDTTVTSLRAVTAPTLGQGTPRISGIETTTYRLSVKLVSFKVEDDRDIHLVVADPDNVASTMIVEFPDVQCEGAISSAKLAEMAGARSALLAACGNPSTSSFKQLNGTATLTGVGFFDFLHGQTGVAPNGVELHPVLSFSGSCASGGTATATPTPTSTATPTSGYSLPGCYQAGQNTCNCPDFTTHGQAQWFHDNYDPSDINKLDADHDGIVCESLPR